MSSISTANPRQSGATTADRADRPMRLPKVRTSRSVASICDEVLFGVVRGGVDHDFLESVTRRQVAHLGLQVGQQVSVTASARHAAFGGGELRAQPTGVVRRPPSMAP
jgi:hypothetical protein